MPDKQVQLEFFEQSYKIRKGSEIPTRAHDVLQKTKFPTQACVILACALIIIIVIFTTGIERGKRIAKNQTAAPQVAALAPDAQRAVAVRTAIPSPQPAPERSAIPQSQPIAQAIKVTRPPPDKKLEKEEKNVTLSSSRYAIQVATYKKDSSYIQKEIAKLKQKGFATSVKTSGDYKIIFAGNFKNAKEAHEQVKLLKKTYKDCFVTKI